MSQALNFDDELSGEKDRLYSCKYELEDIISNLESKRDSIHYDAEELDKLNDRLSYIKDLERKYGNTIEDILSAKEEYEKRLNLLINAEEELNRLVLNKNHLLKEIFHPSPRLLLPLRLFHPARQSYPAPASASRQLPENDLPAPGTGRSA